MKRYTALYAEFIGTFAMVFCGTAAMAVNETTGGVAHEGVAITWGLIVMVMIYAFGSQSGAHFNPAVTTAFALAKRFPWKKVPAYLITQTAAAVAASLAVKTIIPKSKILKIPKEELPKNWNHYPSPDALKSIGKSWIELGNFCTLQIPSAVNSMESNYLINVNISYFLLLPHIEEDKILLKSFYKY